MLEPIAEKKVEVDTPLVVLNRKLDQMEDVGMSQTKKWMSIWRESMAYFYSDQLAGKKSHKNWDWVIINYLWPAAMQEIAKLSKIEHKIIASPMSDNDVEAAEAWESYLQWEWEMGLGGTGMRTESLRFLLDLKIFGYAVSKFYFEPKPLRGYDEMTRKWQGRIQHTLWHPSEFWAGDGEKINEGPCGTSRYVSLDWAINRWSQFENELRDEAKKFKTMGEGGDYIRGQTASSGAYPSAGYGGIDKGLGTNAPSELLSVILNNDRIGWSQDVTFDKTEFVKIRETYFFDYSEEAKTETIDVPAQQLLETGNYNLLPPNNLLADRMTGQELTPDIWPQNTNSYSIPKYPNGRYVIRAGDVILNPGEESGGDYRNQQWNYSQWPFIVIPHYFLPHKWQGIDAVQLYKSCQDMINVTVSHLVNNLKMYGNPKVAVETGAIEAPPGQHKKHYMIGIGAGAVVRVKKGRLGGLKVLDPPQMSIGAMQLYQLFAQETKNLQGLQSMAKGEKEPGEMSATQAQHLAISSYDRIYLQSVFYKEWVKQSCRLIAEIAQKNYDAGRWVRIIGEEHAIGIQQITQRMKEAKYDIEVEAGSAQPFDEEKRVAQYRMAYDILGNPAPNPMTPDMLRILKIPNWQKLLLKYGAYQQFIQLYTLYEQVKAGKIMPQDAVNAIVQRATQLYNQEKAEEVPTVEQRQAEMQGATNESVR